MVSPAPPSDNTEEPEKADPQAESSQTHTQHTTDPFPPQLETSQVYPI